MQDPWRVIISVISASTISIGLALVFAQVSVKVFPRTKLRPGTVWTSTSARYVSSDTPNGRTALFVVAQLADGRSIGGQLLFGDPGDDPAKRDITLAAPIWVSGGDLPGRKHTKYDFVIVRGNEISALWGQLLTVGEVLRSDPTTKTGISAQPVSGGIAASTEG